MVQFAILLNAAIALSQVANPDLVAQAKKEGRVVRLMQNIGAVYGDSQH
jgi:hypothetical protein